MIHERVFSVLDMQKENVDTNTFYPDYPQMCVCTQNCSESQRLQLTFF